MNTERAQRIHMILENALGRAPEQREVYLDEACATDTELREQVARLLHEAQASPDDSFLQPLAFSVKAQLDREGEDVMLGRRLGAYEIQSRLGQGGMGNVYLAARVTDYEQRVAIKLVRRGMDSDEILRRFRHEMQFGAALGKHPNIAGLLDAGTTDGLPYFVMEYVDGTCIDEYCDHHRLKVRERLALFRQVCAAVQFAHQHTVIHRDLKPGNVLITEQGIPKLIDFGIAKLTDPGPGSPTVTSTRTQHRLLTPEYASPEQARGEPLTTATDIYSLGVMLYELLTGRRPLRITSGAGSEIARLVSEQQPPKPSAAVAREETVRARDGTTVLLSPQQVSQARREQPRRLQRMLAGDLDNIVLTALRKEPERRYASVEQLSADIERYLAGRPVTAQKDTWRYRTGKFLRRHRAGVAAAALVVLSLLGGLIGTTTQALRAEHQRARADEARRAAEAMNDFLVEDIIQASDPYYSGHDRMTMFEALQRAGDKLEERFQDQPQLKADLHRIVGQSLLNLGRFDAALEQFDTALRLYEALPAYGRYHRRTIETLTMKGDALDNIDPFGQAQAVLTDALARAQSILAEDDPVSVAAATRLGETLQTIGKYEQAEPLLRRANDMAMRVLGPKDPRRYAALNSLGELLRAQERYEESEPLREQFLDLTRLHLGPEHPTAIGALNQLASLYFYQAKLAHDRDDAEEERNRLLKAEPIFRELVEVATRVLPEKHVSLSAYHGNYGVCLAKLERFEDAEPFTVKAYALSRAAVGEDHDNTEWYLRNAMKFYEAWNKQDPAPARQQQAERHARRCVHLRLLRARRTHDEDDTPFWWTDHLVTSLEQQGRAEEVERLFEELAGSVPEGERRANYLGNLGIVLCRYERYAQAEPLLLASYRERREKLGADHEEALWMREELVRLYEAWGKPSELDGILEPRNDGAAAPGGRAP